MGEEVAEMLALGAKGHSSAANVENEISSGNKVNFMVIDLTGEEEGETPAPPSVPAAQPAETSKEVLYIRSFCADIKKLLEDLQVAQISLEDKDKMLKTLQDENKRLREEVKSGAKNQEKLKSELECLNKQVVDLKKIVESNSRGSGEDTAPPFSESAGENNLGQPPELPENPQFVEQSVAQLSSHRKEELSAKSSSQDQTESSSSSEPSHVTSPPVDTTQSPSAGPAPTNVGSVNAEQNQTNVGDDEDGIFSNGSGASRNECLHQSVEAHNDVSSTFTETGKTPQPQRIRAASSVPAKTGQKEKDEVAKRTVTKAQKLAPTKPFSCDICNKRFIYPKNLSNHKETVHEVNQNESQIGKSKMGRPSQTPKPVKRPEKEVPLSVSRALTVDIYEWTSEPEDGELMRDAVGKALTPNTYRGHSEVVVAQAKRESNESFRHFIAERAAEENGEKFQAPPSKNKPIYSVRSPGKSATPEMAQCAPSTSAGARARVAASKKKARANLKSHGVDMSKAHDGFHCLCGKLCSTGKALNAHVQYSKHKVSCQICGKKYAYPSHLKQHLERTHKRSGVTVPTRKWKKSQVPVGSNDELNQQTKTTERAMWNGNNRSSEKDAQQLAQGENRRVKVPQNQDSGVTRHYSTIVHNVCTQDNSSKEQNMQISRDIKKQCEKE